MTGRTHAIAGVASLWALAWVPGFLTLEPGYGNLGIVAMAATVGALVPDLDSPVSLLTSQKVLGISPFAGPSLVVRSLGKHRGFIHSFLGMAMVCVPICTVLYLQVSWQAALAFPLGYLSHLFCDCLTVTGLPLLWPDKRKRWAVPKPMRIVTGGPWEDLWFALFGVSAFWLVLRLLLPAEGGEITI